MSTGEANIIVTRHDVGMGRTVNSYSFEGDPYSIMHVTDEFITDHLGQDGFPESLQVGPYRLRRAGNPDIVWLRCPYMLDGAMWRTQRAIEGFDRLRRIVKGRVIMTLHIWNLASVSPYAEPSWSDVGKRRL